MNPIAKHFTAKNTVKHMQDFLKDGDIAAFTDLIAAYVYNSSKYPTNKDFAEAIGETGEAFRKMMAHDTVPLTVFFKAIEKIFDDAEEE